MLWLLVCSQYCFLVLFAMMHDMLGCPCSKLNHERHPNEHQLVSEFYRAASGSKREMRGAVASGVAAKEKVSAGTSSSPQRLNRYAN